MSDRRGTSWDDERDRQRRQHPAVEHGHHVLRSEQPSWPDGAAAGGGFPQQRTGPGMNQRGYEQYDDQPPYGSDPNAYPPPGYQPDGYDASGYSPPEYDGYSPPYQGDGYGGPGYGQGYEGYPDPRYQDQGQGQGYEGYPGQAYQDDGYPGQGYQGQGYPGQGYEGYPTSGYPGGDYRQSGYGYEPQQGYESQQNYEPQGYEPQGFEPQGYEAQGFQPQGYEPPGYEPETGYPQSYDPRYQVDENGDYRTGSFIERGFDDGPDASLTTSGRMRAVRSSFDDTGSGSAVRTYPSGSPPSGDPPTGGGKPKRRHRGVLFIMVLVLLAAAGGGYYWGYPKVRAYFGAPDYAGMGSGDAKVKIAKGDTATAIAETLFTDGVVKSKKAFIKAADSDPASKEIEAGWYRLHKHMSAKNALAMLVAKDSKGSPLNLLVYKVTIPEGTVSVDIYALLSKQTGIPVDKFIEAAKDPVALGVDKSWYSAKRDDGRSTVTATVKGFKYPAMIEGFLFPATYNFQPDETAQQMLSDMVSKFNDVMTSLDFVNLTKTKLGNITPIEALIAASIAQKEASTPSDMAGVTKVLYNRVFKGLADGKLGVDSETNYFLRMTGHDAKTSDKLKASELHAKDDPYNTHDVAGFPPGAISSPGEDALKAAVNPDKSKAGYAYFQTIGDNPKVVFSKTFAQFCALNHSC